jgi:hypothetical protein
MSPRAARWSTLADEPTSARRASGVEAEGPPFLAELTAGHRAHLSGAHAHQQWLRWAGGELQAVVRAVEVAWDGTSPGAPEGVGAAVARAGRPDADTLAVLDVTVAPPLRGGGLGGRMLGELDALRARAGLARLLVLVRPHDKRHHPLVPFARYVTATDASGRPCDGWLAAAWEAGLHPVRGVERSLVARAPVADWQRWYGRPFPTSGPYLIEGAIKPAIVEHERDEGRYREPHLWMAPPDHLAQRTVVAEDLRDPRDAWRRALAAGGLVAGSRRHREVRRERP